MKRQEAQGKKGWGMGGHIYGAWALLVTLSALLVTACGSESDTTLSGANSVPLEPLTAGDQPMPEAETGPVPPPPPAGAFLAQIPPDINAELAALEIPIAVPTYLPDGFDLVDYATGTTAAGPGGGPFYWLVYRDDKSRCFAVEYTSGGIGGVGLSQQLTIESSIFGSGYVLHSGQNDGSGLQAELPESDLFSDWMQGDQGFYRLIGAQLTMQTYGQKGCQDMPAEEAVKVIESLTYLQSEIVGDG
jgi:hypothetical protein